MVSPMRSVIFLLLVLVLATSVLGVPPFSTGSSVDASLEIVNPLQEAYEVSVPFDFYVQVFNITGELVNGSSVNCNMTLFNTTGYPFSTVAMTENFDSFSRPIPSSVYDNLGLYPFTVWCVVDGSGSGGFVQHYILVNDDGHNFTFYSEDMLPLGFMAFLPLLLFIFLIFGAASLNGDRHGAIKIGLYLFSFIPFYISGWFGSLVIARYYNFPGLLNALADVTYWFSWIYAVLVMYFIVYGIVSLYNNYLSNKEEKLEY